MKLACGSEPKRRRRTARTPHLFRLVALVACCFALAATARSGAVAGVALAGTIVPGSFSSSAGPLFGFVPKALEEDGIPAIVVAPQGAAPGEPDPEYRDLGGGEDWDTAIGVELPHVIDAEFRTLPDRTGRAIIGVSAGGYGAMILGLHHLGLYSVIESWSGYFHPTDPTGTRSVDPQPWLNAHSFVPSLKRAFAVHPTFLGFYVGAADPTFRQENIELARQLSQAHVPFVFRMYPGGHSQSLWTAEAPLWLRLASAQLAPPS